ncbi:MAG: PQQ-binding-like beta-propeller repeat protein [Planctomycetaceae bacterium]|nr:PQQ-binding-like beta-propeller repeat protein [Planctomycetaceae bacterium]
MLHRLPPSRFAALLSVRLLIGVWGMLGALAVCWAQGPTQEERGLGNPDRRQIQQFIFELETDGTEERPSQAAETFDAAWELVVRSEDLILTQDSGTAAELRAGQHRVDAGARARLERIYRNSSNTFRRTYEDAVRPRAVASLEAALGSDNPSDLTRTILRYQFTSVGQNALQNLIQLHRSRGESLEAALQYSRLTRLQGQDSPRVAFRLAQLWWQAGLDQDAVDRLHQLPRADGIPQVQWDGQRVAVPESAAEIRLWLEKTLGPSGGDFGMWSQPQGNYRRTQLQQVGPPSFAAAWRASAFECAECVECLDDEEINRLIGSLVPALRESFREGVLNNDTVFPVATPVVAGDHVIFRGVAKIRAVNRQSGQLAWETTLIDRQLNEILESWRRQGLKDDAAFRGLQANLQRTLFEQWTRAPLSGQLATDGQYVFAVENSAEPRDLPMGRFVARPMANFLRAYDVQTGLLKGQAGGMIGASREGGRVSSLSGMYFLGSPLVLGEQVFVLAENLQGIFLLKIRLVPLFDDERQIDIRPVGGQLISIPEFPLSAHPVRRLAGLVPSFAQGLLICQTCDGKVVAVSADDQSIRWIYRYADNVSLSELTRLPVVGNAYNDRQSADNDRQSRWVDSLVRIDGERVFLTPRDADRLICIDLKTGAEIWSQPRGNMRQLISVVDDRLVLTGLRHVECRSAETGEQIWKTDLPDARVCGQAICDGRVIQVPATGPALFSLDLQQGRLLLRQAVEGDEPGNLVATDAGFLSQNLTDITHYEPADGPPASIVDARAALLAADTTRAEQALQVGLKSEEPDVRTAAADMMVELLLQSLKLDFEAHSDRIPELQQLMSGVSVSDKDLADLFSSMIVMTAGDATQLPIHWKRVNSQQEKLRQLDALVAQRSFALNQKSAEETVERMMSLLDQTQGQIRDVTSPVQTTSWRLAQASVARGLQDQEPELKQRVSDLLAQRLAERIGATGNAQDVYDWWETGLLCGLAADLAPLVEQSRIRLPEAVDSVMREVTLLQAAAVDGNVARLWRYWAEGRPDSVVGMARRSMKLIGQRERAPLEQIPPSLFLPRDFAVLQRGRVAAARQPFEEARGLLLAEPFVGRPQVTAGPAKIGQSGARLMGSSPQRNVRLLGDQGAFADWNFFQRPNDRTVRAYNQSGQFQWAFEVSAGTTSQRSDPRDFSRYAIAWGHLMALKLNEDIYLLDCANASAKEPPRVLWQLSIREDISEPSAAQTLTPAFQTTIQYDMEPAGFFPVAEISPLGVPVYSGQTLQLRSLFTGQPVWVVEGVPDDCTMTCTESEVLLISRKTGSVECRSLLDGKVTATHSLPDWWDDANENSAASLYELELNPGDSVRWRLTIENGVCLLHVASTETAAIEAWDIRHQRALWRYELSADSVVSNVEDRHIAVLSDGNMLQLVDTASGTSVARHNMPSGDQCNRLYLRRSQDRWVVLTSFMGPDYFDQNPVSDSLLVNGWVCGLSADDGSLQWKHDVDMEWIRRLTPLQAVMPTVSPLLVLMKRPDAPRNERGMRVGPVLYKTRVFDVNSGDIVYSDTLGRDLSYHCMNLDPAKRTITIGFGIRDVTFDYGSEGAAVSDGDDNDK